VTQAIQAIEPEETRFAEAEGWWARQSVLSRLLYWGLHAACLLAFWVGVSTGDFVLFLATFLGRMFFITGAYHRYFSHKSYKTSRPFQLFLGFMGATAVQKGPLWWASHHRIHHKYSDQPGRDPHSPREGFYHSHTGWVFDSRWDDTDVERIADFARYPELAWINRWHVVPALTLALACLAIGGWSGLLWGFVISTVVLWHSTYSINSIAHVIGRRRYETNDTSRNNWALALLTLGEGWHNNHHYYCASARQGFFWWEIDITYYVLRALAAVGLIWDIREPPERVRAATIQARAARAS
jgi:stearoyl-CoA desaturase (delta-9 desaturase)